MPVAIDRYCSRNTQLHSYQPKADSTQCKTSEETDDPLFLALIREVYLPTLCVNRSYQSPSPTRVIFIRRSTPER